MSMTKDNKYYPCTNCKYMKIAGMTSCPFGQKCKCPLYKTCDVLVELVESNTLLHDIPVDLILDVLRNQGYSGELRQTRVVNI